MKKPMLAPNTSIKFDSKHITYPMYCSPKLDGMRLIVYGGLIFSRTGKLQCTQLQNHLVDLCQYSMKHDLVFDGEYWSPHLKFNEIMSAVTTPNKFIHSPVFYGFDCMSVRDWDHESEPPFCERYDQLKQHLRVGNIGKTALIEHDIVRNKEEARDAFENSIAGGCEGIMLRHYLSQYKHGRATLKQGTLFKFKPWSTIDGVIVGYEQGTVMVPEGVTRERDEQGHLKPVHKKAHRKATDTIGAVVIMDDAGRTFKAVGGKDGILHSTGLQWGNRKNYLGKWVEVKYMAHGTYKKPRHAQIVRWRPDRDDIYAQDPSNNYAQARMEMLTV